MQDYERLFQGVLVKAFKAKGVKLTEATLAKTHLQHVLWYQATHGSEEGVDVHAYFTDVLQEHFANNSLGDNTVVALRDADSLTLMTGCFPEQYHRAPWRRDALARVARHIYRVAGHHARDEWNAYAELDAYYTRVLDALYHFRSDFPTLAEQASRDGLLVINENLESFLQGPQSVN